MTEVGEDAERELCGLVSQLAWRLEGHVKDKAADGLSVVQTVALRELTGPMSLRELSQRLCCEPSHTTYVVDRLEDAGLVQRSAHPTDRRVKQVVLTSDGIRVRQEVLRRLSSDSPLGHLSAAELVELRAVLLRALQLPG